MAYTKEQIEAEMKRRGMQVPQTQNAPRQSPEQQREIPAWESFVGAFNRPFERIAETGVRALASPFQRTREGAQRARQKSRQSYEADVAANPTAAFAGELLGGAATSAPFFGGGTALAARMAPQAGRVLQGIVGAGIGGGAYGAAQPAESGLDVLGNVAGGTGEGLLFGTAIPAAGAALRGAGKGISGGIDYVRRGLGDKGIVMRDILDRMTPKEMADMFERYMSGKRAGIQLTPGEASGSGPVAAMEKKAGTSPQRANVFREFKEGQKEAQRKAVEDVKSMIAPKEKSYASDVRESAQNVINQRIENMKAKAAPYYDSVENLELSPNVVNNLTKDSNINKSFENVFSKPEYQTELQKYKPTSFKVLDYVKRNMQDRINEAYKAGRDNDARLIKKAKDKLVRKMEDVDKSGNYKKARSIYEEGLTDVELLEGSEIGKIAGKSDTQLQTVGREIFDPGETDLKKLGKIRDEIQSDNPEAWRGIIRNEMERRLDTRNIGKTENYGSNFYDQILTNPRDFKQFQEALKRDRKAQLRMRDLKNSLKDLVNEYSAKTQAGQAASGVDESRTGAVGKDFVKKLFGGNYDEAFIEVITNPNWDQTFRKAVKKYQNSKDPGVIKKVLEKAQPNKQLTRGITAVAIGRQDEEI